MKFFPNYPNDNNKGQRVIWNTVKDAMGSDEGVAYYRFPIFTGNGSQRKEPDFVLIHRRFGIWVLESKGCTIGNIAAIEGHDWQMRDWYSESMSPVSQVESHFYAVKSLVALDAPLAKLRLSFEYRVVLPFVSADDWRMAGYSKHPSTDGVVWLEDDIEPARLRQQLKEGMGRPMPELSDAQWDRLLGVFRGTVSDEKPRQPIADSPPHNYSRTIHAVESRLRVLDEKQNRIAQEVPEGPQRLRGLAGSGKTVLFAMRVAQMHAAHPEWEIAFVFWSRSLNQQIKGLVAHCFKRLTGEQPDWAKLHVWHAWGSQERTGFYRETAQRWGQKTMGVTQAEQAAVGDESPFAVVCRKLEAQTAHAAPFLDALVVDEGQDLPAAFYRVAYRTLKPPKRLYWAYDEAQGVDSLVVPNAAEVFGRDAAGKSLVDLSGAYASGMQKAHNLNRCYRTPRTVLTAAHAINMGLKRVGGPLQGVTRKEDWTALGYQVVAGDFGPASVKAGTEVVIERPLSTSGHPADAPDFAADVGGAQVLHVQVVESDAQAVEYVVQGIQQDLERGLRPEDIAVVALDNMKTLAAVGDGLKTAGVRVLALTDENRDVFRQPDHVTLASIRRAKGNEAYKVYALNLHTAGVPFVNDAAAEMVARNQAFVALTRTKMWCVAIGFNGAIMQELHAAKTQDGKLRFAAFNQASLKRSMEDAEAGQVSLME